MIGALGLDLLCIDDLCSKDNNFKFLNIVTDASAVNKLAAKIMTYYLWGPGGFIDYYVRYLNSGMSIPKLF